MNEKPQRMGVRVKALKSTILVRTRCAILINRLKVESRKPRGALAKSGLDDQAMIGRNHNRDKKEP
jgi:hypothetical protein